MSDLPEGWEKPWPVLSSRVAFDQYGLKIVLETVQTPGGELIYRSIHSRGDAAATVAVDDDGCVILEREYRHLVGRVIFQLPGGAGLPDEDPAVIAQRELEEEVGFRASEWTALGSYRPLPGSLTVSIHLFFARGLTPAPKRPDPHEFVEIVRMPFDEALQRAIDGEFVDGPLIQGLMWARLKGLA